MYLYVHKHVHIYIYVYIYVHVYVYMSLSISIYTHDIFIHDMYIFTHIHTHRKWRDTIWCIHINSIRIYISICIYTIIYVYMYMYIYKFALIRAGDDGTPAGGFLKALCGTRYKVSVDLAQGPRATSSLIGVCVHVWIYSHIYIYTHACSVWNSLWSVCKNGSRPVSSKCIDRFVWREIYV